MALDDGKCDRCGKATRVHIMSFFNDEDLCMDCSRKEEAHPLYEQARQAEQSHVHQGDYNYKGIGKPHDL